mgnify:CR=1 FL=1
MSQTVIKLESLVRPSPLVIEVEGVRHELVPASVETYIQNMRDIEALALNASPVDEIELAVKLIGRAFPTLKAADIRGWSVDVIYQLAAIARGESGEVASTNEADAKPSAEGNVPAA